MYFYVLAHDVGVSRYSEQRMMIFDLFLIAGLYAIVRLMLP